jgi:hypothetical protein
MPKKKKKNEYSRLYLSRTGHRSYIVDINIYLCIAITFAGITVLSFGYTVFLGKEAVIP